MSDSGRIGLRRSHSLKRARLVRPLFDRSRSDIRSVSAGCFRVMYRPVSGSEFPARVVVQAVFVVSRRVGKAVHRNRIRRHMREAYRKLLPSLERSLASAGACLSVAVVFRGASGLSASTIRSDLEAAIVQLSGRVAPDPPFTRPASDQWTETS